MRLGSIVAKDMIAVRSGPDMRMAVVSSPRYFATPPQPHAPQELIDHACINLRLPTRGGLYAWEFGKAGHTMSVRVEVQLIFNNVDLMYEAALSGYGLAYLAEEQIRDAVKAGRLVKALDDCGLRLKNAGLEFAL